MKELEARIIAHLKREERYRSKSKCYFQRELFINYSEKKVEIGNRCLDLTKLEYEIIEFLSMNAGQVFERERIYEKICGYDVEGDSRVVTELIRRIRNKISECTQTDYIETVWGWDIDGKNKNLSIRKTIVLYMSISLFISFFCSAFYIQSRQKYKIKIWWKYVDQKVYFEMLEEKARYIGIAKTECLSEMEPFDHQISGGM